VKTPACFDIAPSALPNCEPGEVRFEEPRDIVKVIVAFKGKLPTRIGLSYLRKTWPQTRVDKARDLQSPFAFGWIQIDDYFNGKWQKAKIAVDRETDSRAAITFRGLASELPDKENYDVAFRRTLGIRLDVPDAAAIKSVSVFTASAPVHTRLRVELDAGRKTQAKTIRFDGYNALVRKITPVAGAKLNDGALELRNAARRCFELDIAHMNPAHRYSGDDGHVRFITGNDSFTISLSSLRQQGPVWFAEKGFYITDAGDPTVFAAYRAACSKKKTAAEMVKERPEHTYAGAYLGQPRPRAV